MRGYRVVYCGVSADYDDWVRRMKHFLTVLLCVLMMAVGLTVSAAPSSAGEIPVTAEAEFPAAVTEILLDKVFISGTERLTTANVQKIMDGCVEELQNSGDALVPVPTDIVMKHPALKTCATVECSSEFVYTTYFNQGIKYEWMYYPDGRVQKTVSYDYEERSSEFKTYTYTIVNDDNQSLQKSRLEVMEKEYSIHMGDFLFGMAMAVLLMMVGVLIVRAVKKA